MLSKVNLEVVKPVFLWLAFGFPSFVIFCTCFENEHYGFFFFCIFYFVLREFGFCSVCFQKVHLFGCIFFTNLISKSVFSCDCLCLLPPHPLRILGSLITEIPKLEALLPSSAMGVEISREALPEL